jgi:spoIIIJ-associated protein
MAKKRLSVEVEGKTVEEAIRAALEQLKLKRNQVDIEVLAEEKKGLFGMPGAKPAKVKASVILSKENT